MLLLSGWLHALYGVPPEAVVGVALVNMVYGTYSFSLARRSRRPPALIRLLIAANAAWAVLLGLAAVVLAGAISVFGVAHLIGEGLFVGGLAALEWRYRDRLLTAS